MAIIKTIQLERRKMVEKKKNGRKKEEQGLQSTRNEK